MTTDNFCFYLQNRLFQTSQTGGQQHSDTSPFSIPWIGHLAEFFFEKRRTLPIFGSNVNVSLPIG
jgi:hypothetical protein